MGFVFILMGCGSRRITQGPAQGPESRGVEGLVSRLGAAAPTAFKRGSWEGQHASASCRATSLAWHRRGEPARMPLRPWASRLMRAAGLLLRVRVEAPAVAARRRLRREDFDLTTLMMTQATRKERKELSEVRRGATGPRRTPRTRGGERGGGTGMARRGRDGVVRAGVGGRVAAVAGIMGGWWVVRGACGVGGGGRRHGIVDLEGAGEAEGGSHLRGCREGSGEDVEREIDGEMDARAPRFAAARHVRAVRAGQAMCIAD